MPYVEGYLLPVKTDQFDTHIQQARAAALIWLELGALSVMEARAENAPIGTLTSFPRAVLLKDGEEVVFSILTFRDRAHRDQVVALAMAHDAMMALMEAAPIDGKRMIWGGFETFVNV